jgi:adenylate cyclase class 2
MGIKSRGYQENKRTQYILNGVEIDIDSWPMIPTYVEIEGKNEEEVMNTLEILELPKDKVTTLDVDSVYKKYGIDLKDIKVLKFN